MSNTRHHEKVQLCILSDAAGGRYEKIDAERQRICPLGLSRTEARRCPCLTREVFGRPGSDGWTPAVKEVEGRVFACTYPEMASTGEAIRNPEALAGWVRRQGDAPGASRGQGRRPSNPPGEGAWITLKAVADLLRVPMHWPADWVKQGKLVPPDWRPGQARRWRMSQIRELCMQLDREAEQVWLGCSADDEEACYFGGS